MFGSGDLTNFNVGQNTIDAPPAAPMTCEECFASFDINIEALTRVIANEIDIEGFTLCEAIEMGFVTEAFLRSALGEIGIDPDTADSLIQCLRDVGAIG